MSENNMLDDKIAEDTMPGEKPVKKAWKKIVLVLLCVVIVIGVGYKATQLAARLKLNNTMVAGNKTFASVIYNEETYNYRDDLINIVCLGIDKDEAMDERNDYGNSMGQADVIILVSLDVKNHDVRMISIPRDTMVYMDMYREDGTLMGGMNGQIALQYAYGDGQELSATLTSQKVSELFLNIPINGYMALNFESLMVINDAVGGVEITLDEDYTELMDLMLKDSAKFTEGATLRLNGEEALWYIRARDCNEWGSGYTRMERTKQYIMAFVDQAKVVVKEDVSILATLMEELTPYMETSLSVNDVIYIATEALKCGFDLDSMYSLEGELTHSAYHDEFYLDYDAVAELAIELFYEKD